MCQHPLDPILCLRGFDPIAAFGLDDVVATFEAVTERFVKDQDAGERDAMAAVARVKGAERYPALLVETCCAIADADGGFDVEERTAAIRICQVLGLDPSDFGLADAP